MLPASDTTKRVSSLGIPIRKSKPCVQLKLSGTLLYSCDKCRRGEGDAAANVEIDATPMQQFQKKIKKKTNKIK